MTFSVPNFLPYLLNQAAEAASDRFQSHYKERYGMLRTEWRVLFHLACYGDMSAREICNRASLHKTKVSRAVRALEVKRFLTRQENADDRRIELLGLTRAGRQAFSELSNAAEQYEAELLQDFSASEQEQLRDYLTRLTGQRR